MAGSCGRFCKPVRGTALRVWVPEPEPACPLSGGPSCAAWYLYATPAAAFRRVAKVRDRPARTEISHALEVLCMFRSASLRPLFALICCAVLGSFACGGYAQNVHPLLLRSPSLSRDKIAFVYADDIWTVARDGGEAQRLTSVDAVVAGPYYSPGGGQIAYSTHQKGGDQA